MLEHTRGALNAVIAAASGQEQKVSECSAAQYYGVILRNKKFTFFIPSDLYQYVESTHYTDELNDMLGAERFNRNRFIVLFNALCPLNERKIFTCIYPQYVPTMEKIRNYLNDEFISAMYAVYDKITNGVAIDPIYSESTIDLARSIFIVWVRQNGNPGASGRAKLMELFSAYVLDKRNSRVLYHDVYSNINCDL